MNIHPNGFASADVNPTTEQYIASLRGRRAELFQFITGDPLRFQLANACYNDGIPIDYTVDVLGEMPGVAYLKRRPATSADAYRPSEDSPSVGTVKFDPNPPPYTGPEKPRLRMIENTDDMAGADNAENGKVFQAGPAAHSGGNPTLNPADPSTWLVWADKYGFTTLTDGTPVTKETEGAHRFQFVYEWATRNFYFVLADPQQ